MKRRTILKGLGAGLAFATLPKEALSRPSGLSGLDLGIIPGSAVNQGRTLQSALEKASSQNTPLFLEPGIYRVSDVTLPANTRLMGVKGATILHFAGGTHFLHGENLNTLELSGIELDGRLLPVKEYADGNLSVIGAKSLTIRDCRSTNAAAYGMKISGASGHIHQNRIDKALGIGGLLALANNGLTISQNTVEDCANNGIMIHRYERGVETTIVTQNRIRRIASLKGGTGPYGNGILSYQCDDGVIISDNHIADCAFSCIRSNSCNNIQIANNTCLRAGETSIYSEFAFQGANITGNIVDGGSRGISIANLDYGGRLSICANNMIRNITENAPYEEETPHIHGTGILAEADCAITGNVIENTKHFGISLGWGEYLENILAANNVIRDAKTGIYVSVVDGVGPVSLTNNIFSKIKDKMIVGYRWREAVTGDLAIEGSKAYPSLAVSGNMLDK